MRKDREMLKAECATGEFPFGKTISRMIVELETKDARIAELTAELAAERTRCLLIAKTLHPEMYRLHAMIERGCGVVCPNRVCHCDEHDLQSVRAERKRNKDIQELHDMRGGMSKQYWREIDDETC